MPASILALQTGTPYIITTQNGVQEQIGYRPILSVQRIVAKVQTTVFFGNDLYGIGLMSNLDEMTIFKDFVTSFANRVETWVQLLVIPNPPIPYPRLPYLMTGYTQAIPPISTGKVVVMDAGYDPLRGYWIEFAGNYFLQFPIFQDWANSVTRDGPPYKGFQPSTNNSNSNSGQNNPGC